MAKCKNCGIDASLVDILFGDEHAWRRAHEAHAPGCPVLLQRQQDEAEFREAESKQCTSEQ